MKLIVSEKLSDKWLRELWSTYSNYSQYLWIYNFQEHVFFKEI